MEEHRYSWDREFAITRVCFRFVIWASLFGVPASIVWLASLNTPNLEWLVLPGYLTLCGLVTAVEARRYWKRLLDRSPQLELLHDRLRATQLNGKRFPYQGEIPWSDVQRLRGIGEFVHTDRAELQLETVRGPVKLDISGLNARVATIVEAAEARVLAAQGGGGDKAR